MRNSEPSDVGGLLLLIISVVVLIGLFGRKEEKPA